MDLILVLLKSIMVIYDFLTWPIYQIIQRPWEKRRDYNKFRSKVIHKNDKELVFQPFKKQNAFFDEMSRDNINTIEGVWKWCVKKYGDRELLGTREIFGMEDEVQPNGKIFKKYSLGNYRWLSYNEVNKFADYFGKGLRSLGLETKKKICIFADTRKEWSISAQAAFKQNFPIVTLYTNLGEEAVEHGINQTKVTFLITSHELLPKFKRILKNTPTIKTIIYFEDQIQTTDTSGYREDVEIVSFNDVVKRGKKLCNDPKVKAVPPIPMNTAIIMYTSGSTGVPKGVILSHRSIFAFVKSAALSFDFEKVRSDHDCFIAFLPLAHILELVTEANFTMWGVRIGYSSPNTFLDTSTMVMKGSLGDASILKPTFMVSVPAILNRVSKAIRENLKKKGERFENFFQMCFQYKLAAFKRGEDTPIMDYLIFNKIKSLFGGNLNSISCGGAPLSTDTQEFIRICLGVKLYQGYGATESTSNATMTEMDQISIGNVGPPTQNMTIKLENWDEGGYRVTDKPRPRGEIIIGGECVSEGYYEMPEKTAEDFLIENNQRWFRTGDIGQYEDDGTLKIIDRKKDLVKLQLGEYVSFGKVEAHLKTCSITENIWVYADPSKYFTVALLCPDRPTLEGIAAKYGKESLSFEEMCKDKELTKEALKIIIDHGKAQKLEKFEIPAALTLCKEIWLPETGLVTASMKIKRKPVQQFYQKDIDRMYDSKN